jgi:hypothetical protein
MLLSRPREWDADTLKATVLTIVERFKRLVEDNRYSRLLYNDDRTPRKEKIAQLAFFGLADAYCEANRLDISPEADAGVGPVDFKISHGYDYRVTIELKLSSNPNLISGFENQLPAYHAAERALHSIYLVVQNGNHTQRLKALLERRRKALKDKHRIPDIVLVDGRLTASASKRRSAP